MIPISLSPLTDDLVFPADYNGEELILGWRRINTDFTSRDGFVWPQPGNWSERVEADRSHFRCAHGLHVATNWAGASEGGVVSTVLLVAFRSSDVAHVSAGKVRVDQALVLGVVDIPALICDGWFTGADLTGADLTRATLTRAYLRGATLTRATLTGADLTRADLTRAYLTGADLTRADLTEANLRGATLTSADLTRADLTRADLTEANLRGATLTSADLTEANLTRADLTRADLRGVIADIHTVWPTAFNLAAAGVILR